MYPSLPGACTVGNVKTQDTPVEALEDMVSDRGSTQKRIALPGDRQVKPRLYR